jgi:hypothetical protein
MSNLQEAIETCTDMLDVINNCGSAYLYKHNGGDKKIENIIGELSRLREIKYPIGGYAPGDYSCKCGVCGDYFVGDKRAATCKACVLESRLSRLEQAADAVIKLNEDIKNIVGFAETEGVADDKGAKIRDAIDALAQAKGK